MSGNPPNLQSAFNAQLVDSTGQANLIKDSSQLEQVFWMLLNNQKANLEIKSLDVKLDETHYNFAFEFSPPVLTKTPVLEGWEVLAKTDSDGRITDLYVALSGRQSLTITPGNRNKATLIYSDASTKDPKVNKVDLSLTTGENVSVGGQTLQASTYNFSISLVQGNTPMISTPPLAVDFVGRRTLVNNGHTDNEFSFALTNMTETTLSITPDVLFTVWFDAQPNQPDKNKTYPAALARIEDLTAPDLLLTPPDKWTFTPSIKAADITPGNRQWQFKVTENLGLAPQDPIIFKFAVLRTPLNPGISRMYLRFEGLPGFRPGVLIAQLEKTPLRYGAIQGQGLYVSAAGNPKREKTDLTKESGLFVDQTGTGPAAIFNGGNVGIGTKTDLPAAKLHVMDTDQNLDGGTVIVGTSSGPTLRFGCQSSHAWIQSYSAPLVINAAPRPVGIGTTTPGSALSVVGGVAIGKSFAQKGTLIGEDQLAVEKKIGIGVTTPGSALSVVGGAAIGKGYAQNNTSIAENNLAVEGSVSIGTTAPASDLSVAGGVAIGKTYATNKKIAANNLAVEGKVGIGTNDPNNQLHVESADGIRFSLVDGGQLLIVANKDKSVQLVAAGPKGSSKASADFMYLGGSLAEGQKLPKMILNATEVDIQAGTTTVAGVVSGLTMAGDINLQGKNLINFNSGDKTKEASAGRMGYEAFTPGAMDIVGAGTKVGARNIKLWDNIYVPGNIWQFMQYNQTWMALWPSGTSTGAWYNFGPQTSDLTLKKDVQSVSSALDKVRRLAGVSFRWNEGALARFTGDIEKTVSAGPEATPKEQEQAWKEERKRRRKELETPRLGVIAQDVEAVLPEAVSTDPDGYKSVHYEQLIALLIEAVKEQDKIVAQQRVEIDELKRAVKGK